jgi:hypothetical protein
MAVASQAVAGFGIENAATQEGGAEQNVDNIKHGDASLASIERAACG